MLSSRPQRPCTALAIGQQTFVLDGVEMPLRPNIGIYIADFNFIGLPVVAHRSLSRRCRSACRSSPPPGARTWRCRWHRRSNKQALQAPGVLTSRECRMSAHQHLRSRP